MLRKIITVFAIIFISFMVIAVIRNSGKSQPHATSPGSSAAAVRSPERTAETAGITPDAAADNGPATRKFTMLAESGKEGPFDRERMYAHSRAELRKYLKNKDAVIELDHFDWFADAIEGYSGPMCRVMGGVIGNNSEEPQRCRVVWEYTETGLKVTNLAIGKVEYVKP